jgi:hypothetical protein
MDKFPLYASPSRDTACDTPPPLWHYVTPDQTPPTPANVTYFVNGP